MLGHITSTEATEKADAGRDYIYGLSDRELVMLMQMAAAATESVVIGHTSYFGKTNDVKMFNAIKSEIQNDY
jgi:hypothetical protein